MQFRFLTYLVILAAMMAACTAGGEIDAVPVVETNLEPDSPPLDSVTLSGREAYPPPTPAPATASGYPAVPVETEPPTAYPDLTSVPLQAEVGLTPGSPDGGRPVTPTPKQEHLIEAAARNLNEQTDVPVDEIELVSAVTVVWPNTGLGCPAEDIAYAEVQIEGLLVTLRAGDETFTYHTDGDENYVLCRDGMPVSSGSLPQD